MQYYFDLIPSKKSEITMLFHLIYVSTAVKPMSDDDLADLLQICRARNERQHLTGMLLHKNGHFMQVLEGEEVSVMERISRIAKDIRHRSMDTLRAEYIQHRNFPNWTMGFTSIDKLDPATMPGFTQFLERDFRSDYFSEDSVEAHAMLLAFKDSPAR